MDKLYIQAKAFISSMQQFEKTHVNDIKLRKRLNEIKDSIQATGTYIHTKGELDFGAKLAWRNSNRCIGRHYWRNLDVFDCRTIDQPDLAFKALEDHILHAFNNGAIKSTISIFPPRDPSQKHDKIRIINHQLIRYAGFKNTNKTIIGDPNSIIFTKLLQESGWNPKNKGQFTPLPWLIQINGKTIGYNDVLQKKSQLLNEVTLEHPESDAFKNLCLKWYCIPILSDMALKIGGITYPCAPFNGWYMGTEIGARNLADESRYNLLPKIAKLFNLNTKNERSLWRDRALIELNRAVLFSFDKNNIRIGDHHNLSKQFEKFTKNEEKSKCPISGDWSWLVPPISGSQTPTFHQEYDPSVIEHTNFFYQDSPIVKMNKKKTKGTSSSCPYHLK